MNTNASEGEEIKEWLIGKMYDSMTENKLPSKRQVLSYFLWRHLKNGHTISSSANITAAIVCDLWG